MDNTNISKKFIEYKKKCPEVKTIINWYDLYEGHLVTLNVDFQKKIFNEAVKKAGNYSKLGEILSVNRKTISNCSKGNCSSKIKTLIKIVNYIKLPYQTLNKEIQEITGLKPNLPFDLSSKEGAEIRAAFISDGHIDKSSTGMSQYCALEIKLHERLIELCKQVFGDFNTSTYFNSGSNVTKFPSIIGNALEFGGVPRGNKTLLNFFIPKDILLGNIEIQSSYLRRVFDDEGDVCFDRSGKRAVRLTRSVCVEDLGVEIPLEKWVRFNNPISFKHNLLLGEQLLLLRLGIDARLYAEGIYKNKEGKFTAKWRIQIGQQDHLKKFSKIINFSLKEKKDKLNNILSSYKFRKLSNGQGKAESFKFIQKIFNKKGFFKFGDLGDELVRSGRSYDLAGRYLKYFIQENKIKKIKRGVYTFD